ncbi:amino acid transporter [Jannaschia pagri]|uniref:Amino acid transporter n=1 Tax=Jannaschia pagri TaxID=2829797 RepID=A0ABQ4NLQ4_9RHOB|nr:MULTISPECIES: LysE family transporter [unclassified Jannaschia]GIT91511.1 amino acid transporter [Jannaschia sp. AI_61]GIT95345.1 amino acid transporter [Jannaschia sp. AI_62]
MIETLSLLPAILAVALVASASPGPATLAIAATSMAHGAGPGLRLASGVLAGSLIWSSAAAAGLATVMVSHVWVVEALRYAGALYLFWLAFKSLRASHRGRSVAGTPVPGRPFVRGFLLHLTNPKAIFFFGALYAVVLTPGTPPAALALVVVAVGLQSALVFLGYALLLSRPGPMAFYGRATRWIDMVAGLLFAGLGLRLLTTRLG